MKSDHNQSLLHEKRCELKWTKKWLNSKVARSHNYKRHLTQQVYTSTIKVRYSIHIYNESSGHQATIRPHYNCRHHWIWSFMSLFIFVFELSSTEIYLKNLAQFMVYIWDKGILTWNFNHIHANILKTKFITFVLFLIRS